MIADRFSLDELKTLCLHLGVDFVELAGEGKSGRIRDLLKLIMRQDRLDGLSAVLASMRPGAAWPSGAVDEAVCPYKGLFAFRETDADDFFGRKDVSGKLAELVKRQPLLAVVGPSGSGKSSVVFAGWFPGCGRLAAGWWQIFGRRVGRFTPWQGLCWPIWTRN